MTVNPQWEALHAQREWGRYPSEHLVRFVKRTFPERGGIALDLGCGAGAQTRMLVNEGFYVNAVDASGSAIAKLVDILDLEKNVSIFQSDLTEWSGPFHNFYDLIVDVCSLQHLSLDDAVTVISRTHDWLKPGGWFFSLMASEYRIAGITLAKPETSIEPRLINYPQLTALLNGYTFQIGRVVETRPNHDIVSHWIIEAQKPLTA